MAVVESMTIFSVQTYSNGLLTVIPYYVCQTVVVVTIVDLLVYIVVPDCLWHASVTVDLARMVK